MSLSQISNKGWWGGSEMVVIVVREGAVEIF